ncbi:hypothetical protein WN943_002701 [Citrus x changshan-huyou]
MYVMKKRMRFRYIFIFIFSLGCIDCSYWPKFSNHYFDIMHVEDKVLASIDIRLVVWKANELLGTNVVRPRGFITETEKTSVGADEVTKSTTPHKSLPKERYEDHSICENAPASPALEVNVLGVGLKNVARDCFLDVIIQDTLRNSFFDELLKLE